MTESQPANRLVLYVEDEESDALLMQIAFKRAGLDSALRVVADGQAAIEYLSRAGTPLNRGAAPRPSVVLLDLNLPVLPGFEVLKWMRQQPDYKGTPVVIFSSSSRDEDRKMARELGANDYVEKPSSVRLFESLVRNLKQKWLEPKDGEPRET